MNTQQFPNQAVCVFDDPNRPPGYSYRQNNDPTSPVSVAATGAPNLAPVISGGRVRDTATAQDICDYELRFAAAKASQAEADIHFDPRREAHETLGFAVADKPLAQYLSLGWTASSATGANMHHRLGLAAPVTISAAP
jgi:hypothetical protein